MRNGSRRSISKKPWMAAAVFSVSLFTGVAFAEAEYSGSFSASSLERSYHARNIPELARVAYSCMRREIDHHQSFYRKWGISPFYGTGTDYAKMSESERQNYMRRMRLPTYLTQEMRPTSCVGFAMECFEEAFDATGQSDVWDRINRYARKNNSDGGAIIDALQELGWTVMFWNPDTSQNKQWDADEEADDPTNKKRFWGYHWYRNLTVNRHGRYYKNFVDDKTTLVNFGTRVPRALTDAPLFLGTAHTGYHVFPGAYGHVIEAHSTRSLRDYQTIEEATFNPLKNGGAPRGKYRSGLIAVPPGYGASFSSSSHSGSGDVIDDMYRRWGAGQN